MLDTTLAELVSIARSAADARGCFAAMYARVTANVRATVTSGGFDDGARMERFVVAFAARYLDAASAQEVSCRCWRASFDAATDRSLLVVQQLLLGINAHVNFDLPQVVVDLAGEGPIEPLRADFLAVNEVLGQTYVSLLDDLNRVTRWTGVAATHGGGPLFRFSLVAARDQAWRSALRLHGESPDDRARDVTQLDALVAGLAAAIRRPTVPFRWIVPLVRMMETRDPQEVSRRLLGPLA